MLQKQVCLIDVYQTTSLLNTTHLSQFRIEVTQFSLVPIVRLCYFIRVIICLVSLWPCWWKVLVRWVVEFPKIRSIYTMSGTWLPIYVGSSNCYGASSKDHSRPYHTLFSLSHRALRKIVWTLNRPWLLGILLLSAQIFNLHRLKEK